jgi:hypothetical protein
LWTRCSGFDSGLAPASINTKCPPSLGTTAARAGLATPSIVRSRSVPHAMSAPVLPQLTTTFASPAFTNSIARTMDESFFFFRPASGLSSIVMTSEACRIDSLSLRWRP